jgi:hypothetical protein
MTTITQHKNGKIVYFHLPGNSYKNKGDKLQFLENPTRDPDKLCKMAPFSWFREEISPFYSTIVTGAREGKFPPNKTAI